HMCHTIESGVLSENVPTLAGNRFLYWKDQDGNTYAPGASIQNIQKEINLSAVWEETIRVTIQVVIDHNSADGGVNNADDRDKVELQILREENGVNLPVEHQVLQGNYDRETNTSTYTVVLYDQTQAIYHVACVKTGYETAITQIGKADEDQVITVNLQYAPDNFDLVFDVKVNADSEAEKALMPQAVNVKVTYWGYNKDGELGWHIITQQAGNNAPTTITIDENGEGRGFFPVWSYWASTVQAYEYRVEVTSFVMPDGSIVPASGDYVVYTADGSGLYQATVSVENGRVPGYPDDSNTDLSGAYYDGNGQAGQILVTVDITPFTVTFDAGEGKVNDKKTLTLENQYRYPQLDQYVAVSDSENRMFIGWTDADGNPVPDLSGQLLTESVTYYARYSECISVSGTVSADATYMQGEQLVHIHDIDRATTVWVVLQKKVGDVYNDMRSVAVELIYETDEDGRATVGLGTYSFEDLPNDGTEYRVHILVNNYDAAYDHDQDGSFSDAEATLHFGVSAFEAQVDIDLSFAPTQYQQAIIVDTSQIQQDLRPTGVLAQVIYRDLGEAYHYAVISQHTVDPYGIKMTLPAGHASTFAISDLWCWHTNGTLYEYQ
ncbi:MAG: hypothetical protein J6Q54_08650, partial [Oscillospiraceae bacterium]|nr:hypothetical protein [Oscillospiraceae bacterium]